MVDYQFIRFRIEDRVARIALARPPLNVIHLPMMRELADCLRQCQAERDMVALVFETTAEARAFSVGLAMDDYAAGVVYQTLDTWHGLFRQLRQLSKPALALVDGAALGGGCELVAACDVVLATERARFGKPEIKLGLFPTAACALLPRIVGEKRARELILLGDMWDAATAWRYGLVNHIVPPAQLESKAQEMLSKLRELSASVLQITKQALELGASSSFMEALDNLQEFYLNELMRAEDAQEGVRAFAAARKPIWRNR